MVAECPLTYVRSSGVRTGVLEAVADAPAPTRDLVARLDASESAVYEAVDDLAERGILRESGGEWEPTGAGTVVLDLLERQRETTDVLRAAPDYWEAHTTGVLPRRCREELGALAGFEIVRGTATDPTRPVRESARRIEAAERVDVITHVHQSQLSPAVRETDAEMRYVLDRSLVEEFATDPPEDIVAMRQSAVRVADANFAFFVTEDCLVLSLPLCTGEYDPRSVLVAEGAAALDWGRRLFDHYWSAADPLEAGVEQWPVG
ncbi:MAG: helix-turn-helix transcriptional regulator [Halobacteriaceae archaeon]